MMIGKILRIISVLALVLVLSGCSDSPAAQPTGYIKGRNETDLETKGFESEKNPIVEMTIKDYGTITIELYPDVAPNTVNNFIYLVKTGFYDNNTIHRMLPGFVIQGGDPDGNGKGGPGYAIKGEFASNGFENSLKHTKGVLSMARKKYPLDSAGSQFFIMLGSADHLDGEYAAFGKVIKGYDEVCTEIEKIKGYDRRSGLLNENLTIEKAVVDTKGLYYPDPEKV